MIEESKTLVSDVDDLVKELGLDDMQVMKLKMMAMASKLEHQRAIVRMEAHDHGMIEIIKYGEGYARPQIPVEIVSQFKNHKTDFDIYVIHDAKTLIGYLLDGTFTDIKEPILVWVPKEQRGGRELG